MLDRVLAPTLLLVPASDPDALEVTRNFESELRPPHAVVLVDDPEEGAAPDRARARIERLAAAWFGQHLPTGGVPRH